MARAFKTLALLFAATYLFALAILVIGTLGLFGQEKDPLSGIFVVMLGAPWNRLADLFPPNVMPLVAALTPLVNLGILVSLARWAKRRGR
ncbi:hypothetical protein [Celeribacter sp. PS-C1]|uniref:hypothetical protein n=1 Tax=Celeribacter sp. PS-C1 TaxID=2820813 RepID=UPI001CA5A742|nr:hypothetical protein [Celeribacter sp. PS-C1]MBW6419688.1 hypothetical protein [Celeribacter sp. PS-C1]